MLINVPAHAKTIPSSYKIQIVNNAFKLPLTVTLTQNGRSPGRYIGVFRPPSHDFKLILEGNTKEGMPFKRLCNGHVKPTTAVIHVYAAPRGFVLNAGSSAATTILFAVNNFARTEAFTVKVKELTKYATRYPKRLLVINGRMALFPVTLKAPREARRGSTHKVAVSVVGQRSGMKASILVSLLIL